MSSRYPILHDRPIDQWKVTALKDELKRRKLTTKGLKDDLIRRLDEALRIEMEAAESSEKDEANAFNGDVAGLNNSHMETVVAEVIVSETAETVETSEKGNTGIVEPIETENAEKIPEVVDNDREKSDKLYGVTTPVDINSNVPAADQEVEHMDFPAANVGEDLIVHASTIETTVTVTESVLTDAVVSVQDSYSAEPQNNYGDSAAKQENVESKAWLDNKDSKPPLECDLKPPCEDLIMPDSSLYENQVSEVNPSLGSQVKSDSISCNSVSINNKNELRDTIIADNVKLEQDIFRPEMVQEPLSRNDIPVYDESHSMDVEELREKKESVEQNSSNKSPDLNKINSGEDVGYPEKLNLDRSSCDDSMEEDLLESKQFDFKSNVDEIRDKGESVEVPIVKEEGSTVVVGDGLSLEKVGIRHDNDIPPVSLVEKRKFHDQASVGNNEPAKRQRRWNSETVKGSDSQSPTLKPVTAPKDEPMASKRNFSRFDSSTINDAPKERIVPPSQRAPTNSLRIDQFLRPFTLKSVQKLLGKTGNVISFWMDQIKTHCYITYTSVEEAIETRNAVYNLQWPPNGGRLLVADYVDPQEVKMKLEAPPTQVAPVSSDSTVPPAIKALNSQPKPSPIQHREQPLIPATLPPPPPLSKPLPAARERLPPPPPLPEKFDQPIVTLDDLFRKTRATPRVYYLPLSEEQVAAKLAAQGRSIKQ
ncbi:uncharacterized protein LOC133290618 [Gastrolobium bilobum]|uniref:uncharacterized protein LOC133290618 n=1 Tax=Gastrolobium bilobum TaxID=150636 RepID=UPI002AB27614|nr:uncharacterized protein LOC133290618 [Gastrolobium bilobum]